MSIHLNDIGTVFKLTVVDQDGTIVDISAASAKTINFRKPSGTVTTVPGVFVTDGTDGKVKYTAIAGDLDQLGEYKLQADVTISAGFFQSDLLRFTVTRNV